MTAEELLRAGPVMPVLVIRDAGQAVDLATALVAGGIRTLEVTLRTPAALDAIRQIRDRVPGALVGAGTVLSPTDWQRAQDAGAMFGISPGLTPALLAATRLSSLPFVPGVATASEAMTALDAGFTAMKLFPAEAVGGQALLKSLHGPLPQLLFCPTGGIHPGNAAAYLALPNVGCVGGSWLAPEAALAAHDWAAITALAREAAALRR
ncbi:MULTISPECIES: bifunctional 4-hydroxy-2-oxoglutarate aldolase/2-dehydro-3-deoxy-phosphogluconate aldolase [unclassified Thiomonas]|jgi:2-dehydro-3-deoxyphosphogluconate aldolase/(4S)-4-hydroxy-2-oxoglutarate aldolase|uniref:bifunctional 4-hydroxy-2-oxoglutarate aldolase/2-dehydro-3-deoxy-phosphogluconate aldolase n=1 Tax=unclassified Thiomonas TaxID=2625466 RepID=UPI000BDBE4E4|nr:MULTISPECIES: bifunctional 4-hydroxy-2-oxoglutarate aldolase/2-dehydro-3-deoxy-phosphogluconate aldolase [unclassified Thiomonas]OZB69386.1 MAG: keto-deoxy-phosphogluconate aldolase [Thiomonas sp. 13-64-67]